MPQGKNSCRALQRTEPNFTGGKESLLEPGFPKNLLQGSFSVTEASHRRAQTFCLPCPVGLRHHNLIWLLELQDGQDTVVF